MRFSDVDKSTSSKNAFFVAAERYLISNGSGKQVRSVLFLHAISTLPTSSFRFVPVNIFVAAAMI